MRLAVSMYMAACHSNDRVWTLVQRGPTWYCRVHVHRHGAESPVTAGDSVAGKLARGPDDPQAHARQLVALARAQGRATATRVAGRAAGRPRRAVHGGALRSARACRGRVAGDAAARARHRDRGETIARA